MTDIAAGLCVIGRANQMGLGSMTEDFVREMRPDSVIVIDPERGQPLDTSALPSDRTIVVTLSEWATDTRTVRSLIHGAKIIVGFETFYRDDFPELVRILSKDRYVATVCFPMWECSPESVAEASCLIHLSDQDNEHYLKGHRLDWPASPAVHDPDRVTHWPPRTFVHIAGNANHGRNSTAEVLKAAEYLRGTSAKLAVYHAFPIYGDWLPSVHAPVEFRGSVPTRRQLLEGCDCLVHPQQFEGLSLPISEAAGEGIPIIALDLPQWCLWTHTVTARPVGQKHFSRTVDVCAPDPDELGLLMQGMAQGTVPQIPLEDRWRPPTWDEFRRIWKEMAKGVVEAA